MPSEKRRSGLYLGKESKKYIALVFGGFFLVLGTIWGTASYFTEKSDDFFWLTSADISSVYSSPDIPDHPKENFRADKLVDGRSATMASPINSKEVDYTVELAGYYELEKIEIVWGKEGGTSGKHIQRWSLEAESDDGSWIKVAGEDKPPFEEITVFKINVITRTLRLRAGSDDVYIGVFELKIKGKLIDSYY